MRSSFTRKATGMTMAVTLLAVTAQAAVAQAKGAASFGLGYTDRRRSRTRRSRWGERLVWRTIRARRQGASRVGKRNPRHSGHV